MINSLKILFELLFFVVCSFQLFDDVEEIIEEVDCGLERVFFSFFFSWKYWRIVRQSDIFDFNILLENLFFLFSSIHLYHVAYVWFGPHSLNLFLKEKFNAVQHLPFVRFIHFRHKLLFVVCHFFEHLYFIGSNVFFKRVDVEVIAVSKEIAHFASFF